MTFFKFVGKHLFSSQMGIRMIMQRKQIQSFFFSFFRKHVCVTAMTYGEKQGEETTLLFKLMTIIRNRKREN
jgi:hypothetical protein